MCFPTLTSLGSVFLLFAFILELFIMIANLSIKPLLTKIPMAAAWNPDQNLLYTFGLWNYCTGPASGVVESCAKHVAAYNWAQTPTISDLSGGQSNSWMTRGLFMGLFILFFIAVGFSFILWCMSLPICCLKRRGWGISMSTLVFINFMITLTALILLLVVVLSGIRILTNADNTWHAHAGNSVWIAIGATISLLIAFFCYSGGTCFAPKNRTSDAGNRAETGSAGCCGGRRKNKRKVDPNYTNDYDQTKNDYNNILPGSAQPLYASSPAFQSTQQTQQQPQANMLQQPYAVSPQPAHQRAPDMTGASNRQNYDSNVNIGSGDVGGRGYQTPVLQPANPTQ